MDVYKTATDSWTTGQAMVFRWNCPSVRPATEGYAPTNILRLPLQRVCVTDLLRLVRLFTYAASAAALMSFYSFPEKIPLDVKVFFCHYIWCIQFIFNLDTKLCTMCVCVWQKEREREKQREGVGGWGVRQLLLILLQGWKVYYLWSATFWSNSLMEMILYNSSYKL